MESYYYKGGGWLHRNFEKVTTENFTNLFYQKIIPNSYVDVAGTIKTDSNFNLYFYDVQGCSFASLYFSAGGGYAVFYDENDSVVGTPFRQTANVNLRYYSAWIDVLVPNNARTLKVTQYNKADNTFAIKVLADNRNLGISTIDLENEIKNIDSQLSGKQDISMIDLSYSKKILNTYVNSTNVENKDSNFDLYYYDISGSTKITLFVGTGGGFVLFVDSSNTIVGTPYQNPLPDRYPNIWIDLTVPENAVTLKVTQVKDLSRSGIHPLRTLANFQGLNCNENTTPSEWDGKKVLFIGDSITDTGYYVSSFQSKTGCIAYNRGLSGTTLAVSSVANSMCERLDLPASDLLNDKTGGFPTSADLVFVLGGINDWGRLKSQVFGDFNDAIDNTTFCGALKYLFRGLKLRYPGSKIAALNLLHCYSPDNFPAWNELNYQDQDETKQITINFNSLGKSMYDYRDAIAYCAKMYAIPVIDFFDVGFSSTLLIDRTNYYNDGLHPNQKGGELMADFILKQLSSL